MERLWSFLRRFSRMTKEMRPSHRTDILCHALIYYGHKTKQKLGIEHYYHNIIILFAYLTINKHYYLGPLLLSRWKRAEQMKCVASKNYQELTSVLPCMYLFGITVIQTTWFIPNYFLVSVTEEVLEHWIRNEKDVMLQSSSDSSNATSWTTTYFLTLHSYYFLRYVYCI